MITYASSVLELTVTTAWATKVKSNWNFPLKALFFLCVLKLRCTIALGSRGSLIKVKTRVFLHQIDRKLHCYEEMKHMKGRVEKRSLGPCDA